MASGVTPITETPPSVATHISGPEGVTSKAIEFPYDTFKGSQIPDLYKSMWKTVNRKHLLSALNIRE